MADHGGAAYAYFVTFSVATHFTCATIFHDFSLGNFLESIQRNSERVLKISHYFVRLLEKFDVLFFDLQCIIIFLVINISSDIVVGRVSG